MAGETTTNVDRTASDGVLERLQNALEGPNTLGQGRTFWIGFTALVGLLLVYPMLRSSYYVSNTAYLLVSAFLGLSLCIVWGYTGIFSFGQVAFYGVAGYTFGIVSINVTGPVGTLAGLVVAIAVAGAFAFFVGYFMFYGGVSDVYVAIITLAVTLVLNTFMGQTAGEEWAVGAARLGGFNGMTEIPSLAIGVGDTAVRITDAAFYYFVVGSLLLTYLGLRVLVNSDVGYVMVGIRENQDRTELFGYNTQKMKLGVFTFGGVLAGFGGVVYASWGNYIDPSVFGLTFAALPIIWVATGGRKWLSGAIIGTFSVAFISQKLSVFGGQYSLVILGALLLFVILILPEGFVPQLYRRLPWLVDRLPGGESE
ncbi:ABC transporter permease subunit [Haloplanus aerogenes]|uniref:Branched-chain amino acid transport system permease protein n=1 Tax=Haloplanus aerogenes TaxID=660522 RepID=A0A3M0DSP1_9EURY|nr:urea ABC transporter permease [Haloplanus aerogenes]AZH25410.1 urea ABC transporter permease [Haloplanus aerogenes]RMB25119.1 branched-chain amino acid transport system permease protein [Haloplanus aerogenes]